MRCCHRDNFLCVDMLDITMMSYIVVRASGGRHSWKQTCISTINRTTLMCEQLFEEQLNAFKYKYGCDHLF